ncbi:MAG: restriction endonuclease subunit S [Cytophagales bacterium]|nr:restriction endonuclease subunit S [Cytophagales bacterium]MCA6373225.1 restriction endonuclease subunit S [Cytophagales bacterium]MCA6377793.1 restriction endonuclease subunit S [Cytophagales bacterium]MCA6386226.1 restriction endonuclease subunit S [Cytophagales bacterium]
MKLGEACNVLMGQSPPSTSYNTDGIGVPFFQGKAEFTDLHPVVEKWCSSPNKIAEPNDILLSVRAPVGTTNIADQKCCIGRGLAAIRFPNYKYAFYFLRSIEQQLDKKGTGTTFRAISGETIRETLFPLASETEQHAIVSKIEELLSELDKGKQQLETAHQQLKIYRQAVLKWAFEGKLTNENVKEGKLPKGWTIFKFGDITINFDGKRIPLSRDVRATRKGEYRYYGATEVVDHIDDYIFDGVYLLIGEDGANLLTKSRPLAFIAEGKFWVNNHAHVLQAKENLVLKYLLNYFNSINLGQYVTGSAQPKLTQANLNKIPVPIPIIEEQQLIIQEIESRLSVCDKVEETITTSLKQAETLRQSILKKAFEGKLV